MNKWIVTGLTLALAACRVVEVWSNRESPRDGVPGVYPGARPPRGPISA